MIARNVTSAAATRLGYGLAVARAVGRNSAALRAAAARPDGVGMFDGAGVPPTDLRTLAEAGLIELDMAGRRIAGWRLTDAGRDLAARL